MEYTTINASEENFSNYGYFIDEKTQEPLADNKHFTYWDKIAEFELGPVVSAGIVIGHENGGIVGTIERHKNTAEILVSIKGDSVVLLGQPNNKTKKVSELQAFKIKEGDTVVLNPGTWHSAPIPIKDSCKLLVLFNTDTPDLDLEEIELNDVYVDVN